jgi:hypothetical protein
MRPVGTRFAQRARSLRRSSRSRERFVPARYATSRFCWTCWSRVSSYGCKLCDPYCLRNDDEPLSLGICLPDLIQLWGWPTHKRLEQIHFCLECIVFRVGFWLDKYGAIFEVGEAGGTLVTRHGVKVSQIDRVLGTSQWESSQPEATVESPKVDTILRHAHEASHYVGHTLAPLMRRLYLGLSPVLLEIVFASTYDEVVGEVVMGIKTIPPWQYGLVV